MLTDSLWAFGAIAAGAFGCVVGGHFTLQVGRARVARFLLSTSGICIVLTSLLAQPYLFGLFLLIWEASVAGDSPQFSTLVASHAAIDKQGSVLTLVTYFGIILTAMLIQLMAWLITGISG